MNEILFHYQKVDPTTWVYVASLLTVGLFFKFGRFWSVRNLDIFLLILLAPGLLLVSEGQKLQRESLPAIAAARAAMVASAALTAPSPGDPTDTTWDEGEGTVESAGDPAPPSARPDRNGRLSDASDAEPTDGALSAAQDELRKGRTVERMGFLWLLAAGGLLLVRMLVDATMVRRPLLEPNMTTGGLTFSCCSLFVFLMANVVASRPTADDLLGPAAAQRMLTRQASDEFDRHGPGYALVFTLPSLPTDKAGATLPRHRVDDPSARVRRWNYRVEDQAELVSVDAEFLGLATDGQVQLRRVDGSELLVSREDLSDTDRSFVKMVRAYTLVAKLVAILSHLAILVGIVGVGYWHFNNVKMGIGAATLYLMLPYTSQLTGRVDHVLPAALLVWAVLCYQRPIVSGLFFGLATGVSYYPLFLLPLWVSFYWHRGLLRFISGLVATLAVMVALLAFVSADAASFWMSLRKMFGLMPPQMEGLGGIWALGWAPVYRWPILAAFVALSGSLAIWPAQKNLGTLLSCSAAVMLATQFWHGHGGGLYMAWYLPLVLLTIFRPNLEDRVAVSVVAERSFARK